MRKRDEIMSGTYIPFMETPQGCFSCPISRGCPIERDHVNWPDWITKRPEECQLVEVPGQHGKLIDQDELLEKIRQKLGIKSLEFLLESERTIVEQIIAAPAVIEAEEK